MKDVKDFDDVRWDDGKPTVTDYVWGRDNQTASLIRAYKDEIERLRAEVAWHEEENHRLRAALHKIAEWDLTGTAIAALGEKE